MEQIMTLRGFQYDSETEHVTIYKREGRDDIFVFKQVPPKLSINIFSLFVKILDEFKGKHCIMIYQTDITPHVKEILNTTNCDPTIEVFCVNELLFDILAHELQPHFQVVEDTADLEKRFGLVNLPKFKATDPVVKRHGWLKNTVVKIVPKNGMRPSWRIVI